MKSMMPFGITGLERVNTWMGSNEVVEPALYFWFMWCAVRTLPNVLAVL